MIKKLLFIVFLIYLATFVSQVLNYNDKIIITTLEYQISSTTSFVLFLLSGLILSLFLIIYILFSIFSPDIKRVEKSKRKLEQKFEKYLNLITEGLVYKNVRNSKEAWTKLKKANKVFKETNLSKFLESQIFYIDGKYQKSETSFREIKDSSLNLDLLNLKNSLNQAKKIKNEEDVEKFAIQILKIEPIDAEALNTLLNIYISKKKWIEAEKILKKGLKAKVFDEEDNKEQILFVYTSLARKYFDNQHFAEAKSLLREVYYINPKRIEAIILLVETYIAMGKIAKALTIIKRTWKHTTNPKLADLYFSIQKEKDKNSIKTALKLYKLNTKSFESNLVLANAFYKNQFYSKARKYAKIAYDIAETKDLYELMLKIEQDDNGSSAIINILKNRILSFKNPCWKCSVCKSEYCNWQSECSNCKTLDSLKWSE